MPSVLSNNISINNLSITGDCSSTSSGAFYFEFDNAWSPNYTIDWISPSGGTSISLGTQVYYELYNLPGGTYSLQVRDSSVPNNVAPINIYISTGTCTSIIGESNTSCGYDNGSITAQTQYNYGVSSFYLYSLSTSQYITSGTSLVSTYVFDNLSADTYYVVGDDGGGCTGSSESCIIKSSTTFTYGIYVVNNSPCNVLPQVGNGKLIVTGVTGVAPYTYLWSNGDTSDTLTGLTAGTYSVTVTDNTGCSVLQSGIVGVAQQIGLGSFVVDTTPTCYNNDGELTINIVGGTPPYYYNLLNTNQQAVSFGTSYQFTGLAAGQYTVTVTDASFCYTTNSYNLISSGNFVVMGITTTPTVCQGNVGTMNITAIGGNPLYSIDISGPINASYSTATMPYSITSLPSGTYTVTINDNNGNGLCPYTTTVTIDSESTFDVSVSVTGATCGLDNGSVEFVISGGTSAYTYDSGIDFITTSLSSYTFTNYGAGTYTATLNDNSNPPCYVNVTYTIPSSSNVNFVLIPTNPNNTNGDNGTVTSLISQGTPPFTYNWSTNVNGQTGSTVTGLTAGTYTLLVTDNSGCTYGNSVTLGGQKTQSSYVTYTICDDDFQNNGVGIKGLQEMLNNGYQTIISAQTGCTLTSTTFTAIVSAGTSAFTSTFYVGSSINDIPTNILWVNTIKTLLNGIPEIKTVNVDIDTNKISITTGCVNDINDFVEISISIYLQIDYEISCDCPI